MKHPPYHLRTNKAVDRLLLVDVLRRLGPHYDQMTYYTLAGPFLEDLRVIDHFFPDIHLVSLESNEQTFNRQNFHKFTSNVDLRRRTLADFLAHDYKPGVRDIFWLDYTDLKYARFGEFQGVLQQVPDGSVVRITLRAEQEIDLDRLRDRVSAAELSRVQAELETEFVDMYRAILPSPTPSAFSHPKQFARTVQLMVRLAASAALDTAGSERDYLPIHSIRYNDNTQMLTVTGIVCNRNSIDATKEQLKSVRFVDFDWNEPIEVNIPDLSIKERLHLESQLPIPSGSDAGTILYETLAYMTADNAKATKNQLARYADFFREYPHFIRLTI